MSKRVQLMAAVAVLVLSMASASVATTAYFEMRRHPPLQVYPGERVIQMVPDPSAGVYLLLEDSDRRQAVVRLAPNDMWGLPSWVVRLKEVGERVED